MEQLQYVTEAEHLICCSSLLIQWLDLKLLLYGKNGQVCQLFTPGSFSSTSGDFLVIYSKFLSAL